MVTDVTILPGTAWLRRLTQGLAWLVLTLALPPAALAGDVINGIKLRGELRCGVSEGIAGFSERDASGEWHGLDADFCRAVAAALFNDSRKVSFVPLKASSRFPALQSGRIDLLARNTSWTFVREAVFNVQFPAVLFFDGQGFMVAKASGITRAPDLNGATICVEKGTTHLFNLEEYADANGLSFTPLILDSSAEVGAARITEDCLPLLRDHGCGGGDVPKEFRQRFLFAQLPMHVAGCYHGGAGRFSVQAPRPRGEKDRQVGETPCTRGSAIPFALKRHMRR